MDDEAHENLLALTADIVIAHVSNNSVGAADLPELIARVHGALAGLGTKDEPEPDLTPAVSVRASVKPDHLVCLEDGKKFQTLKRHLSVDHGLTPEEYRAKWDLPSDYPMTARNYSERRQAMAKKLGLGRKPKATAKAPVKTPARKPRAKKKASA